MSANDVGLRERKKQQTRSRLAETALRLFLERGFDAVTVDDIAQAAEVARQTVFNYFPSKEDLVIGSIEPFEADLLATIGERPPGESILVAFSRFLGHLERDVIAERADAGRRLRAVSRLIAESPALQIREQQTYDRFTKDLAELIARELGARVDDITPWVLANALVGVYRALALYGRRQAIAGAPLARIARGLRAEAAQALASLENGLGRLGASAPDTAP